MSYDVVILIDSNVIFSGLYKITSVPGLILYLGILGRIRIISPESVRDEVIRVLKNKLGYSDEEIDSTLAILGIEWIPREVYDRDVERYKRLLEDYGDRSLLACAINLNIPIVTGDKDFKKEDVKKIARIYTPSEFIEYLVDNRILSKKEINEILNELAKLEKLPY